MKNRKLLFAALVLSLSLSACKYFNRTPSDYSENTNYPMLDSADVFKYGTVRDFKPEPPASNYARRLFLNAIDIFINNKNAVGSLPVFLQSIRIDPQADSYLRYGDALFQAGQIAVATEAYNLSSMLGEGSTPEAHYGLAKCYAIKGDTDRIFYALETALMNFPFERTTIDNEKAFDAFRNHAEFSLLLAKYVEDETKRLPRLLALFEANFPKAALPYSIEPDSLNMAASGKSIDYRFSDLIEDLAEGEFDRDVSKDFQYVASFDVSPSFKTLLYRSVDVISETMNPVHYYLATINNDGELLFQQEVACFCSPLTLKTFTIDAQGKLEVKEILQTWKEDPIYKGYAGNEVVKQEVKEVKQYTITNTGEIAEPTETADYKKAPEVVNVEVYH